MAQNITLLGASYSDVPSVLLPKTGGGTASFTDVTDTTAAASDVASGKYFYTAAGVRTEGTSSGGGTPAISVVDTTDTAGGTIRTITALDISDTTAVASDVASGKYFYTAAGVKTQGTGGGTPSQTQHTIYFEFTDSTNTSITGYWDDTFISNAITATTPTTYSSKTVTLAQLDGVTWYSYSPGTWETVYNGTTQLISDTPYPYFWISDLSNVTISVGSVWRVTINGVQSPSLTATNSQYGGMIGNPLYSGGSDDGSGLKYDFFNAGWGAWSGGADMTPGNYTVKIERQTS